MKIPNIYPMPAKLNVQAPLIERLHLCSNNKMDVPAEEPKSVVLVTMLYKNLRQIKRSFGEY